MTSATLPSRHARAAPVRFTVAAIHDGLADGIRAQEALKSLHHALAPDIGMRQMLWSYQKLERLDIRAMALHAAEEADMIILAAGAQAALPSQVERWLDNCLAERRARLPLLVCLADDEGFGTSGADGKFCSSFRRLASRWQADFMTASEMDRRVDVSFIRQRIQPGPAALFEQPWLDFGTSQRLYGIND